jgi:putative FmdB family regulatory protein
MALATMRAISETEDLAGVGPASTRGIGDVEYLMPLFEYECRTCSHQFEYLTRAGQSPVCPKCESAELQKRLSAFAVGASGVSSFSGAQPAGACGSCGDPRGPGACSMN